MSLVDEWKSKMCHIHTMGYSSASKKKGTLTYTTIWMNLEKIMLSQSQKDK